MARLSNPAAGAAGTGLRRDLTEHRTLLDWFWFCFTIVEHESNWESPSRAHSLYGASGYNNFGGMYRRYSMGSGGTLAFPAFPGDRLLFNGDAALIAALKVVALQRAHKPERLVFLADSACGQSAWELLRLLQRRSGWEVVRSSSGSLCRQLRRLVPGNGSSGAPFSIAGAFSTLAGVGPAALAAAAHVISFGSMSHVAAAQWARLPQEIRIYFSPTVLQERLALVFPPPELHRAFVIQQQRGGALNEWALKFLSYRSDQEQVLDQLLHNL